MTERRLDGLTVRTYRDGDEQGILACYAKIFEQGVLDLEQWNWKFRDNPTGRVEIVVADHDTDGIVGVYAAIPYRADIDGEEAWASQGVDLAVLPEYRRVGPPPGLFISIGSLYHDEYCGQGPERASYYFGLPIPAWKHGHRHFGYQVGRDWDFLFLDPGSATSLERRVAPGLEVRTVETPSEDHDELELRVRPELRVAIRRDRDYWRWRYAARPDRTYRLLECRDRSSGKLRGAAVYSVADLLRPRTAWLVDWLVPSGDLEATEALICSAETHARADRTGALAALFSQVDPRFLAFQDLGFRVMGSPYFLAVVPYRHSLAFFRERWYFTLGDSDLV